VALSRMVDRGELTNRDGVYSLAGALLERQDRQDRSRLDAKTRAWDQTWEQVVVTATGRSSSARTRLRRDLATLGLGELREGVWMRPANLEPDRQPSARSTVDPHVCWFRVAPMDIDEGSDLAARLFDLDEWALTAEALRAALGHAHDDLDTNEDAVVSGFNLASGALRHLVHDPQLPPDLAPAAWPAQGLRRAYADYEQAYQGLLRRFFRTAA